MASIPRFLADLAGTGWSSFRVGGKGGFRAKNTAGAAAIRNDADSADAPLTASELLASGDQLTLNSDAAGAAADWKLVLKRAVTGMTALVTFVFPPNNGSPNQVLQTDGSGNTTWVTPTAGSSNGELVDDTALAFGSTATLAMFTKPAGSKVSLIRVYVDTAFAGGTGATLSIGITGTLSKYMGTGDVDLTAAGIYEIDPGIDVTAGAEALVATYSAGSATSGAARIEVRYVTPT